MKVKVFSADWCPYCIKVKEFLKGHKIGFEEVNIDESNEAKKELVRLSGQAGIPVTVIDGKKVIVGFDVPMLVKELRIKEE